MSQLEVTSALPAHFDRLPWPTIEMILDPLNRSELAEVAQRYPEVMYAYYERRAQVYAAAYPQYTIYELANILRTSRVVIGNSQSLEEIDEPLTPMRIRSDGQRSFVLDEQGYVWVNQVLVDLPILKGGFVEIYPLPDGDVIARTVNGESIWYHSPTEIILLSVLLAKVEGWWGLTVTGEIVYLPDVKRSCPSEIGRVLDLVGVQDLVVATFLSDDEETFQALIIQDNEGSILMYTIVNRELINPERLPFAGIRGMYAAPDLYTLFLVDDAGDVWTYPSDPELELHDYDIIHLSKNNELPFALATSELTVAVVAYDTQSIAYLLESCDGEYWTWRKLGRYRDVSAQGDQLIALTWEDIPTRRRLR